MGAIVEPPVDPDWVPVASVPSPDAAKALADAAANRLASNSEVNLMFIRVRLQR
ncbi:hypothetical protein J2Y86_005556 [Pseudomonas migulae]|nr:hypothetical protein [Pseudomonas migulae]